MKTNKPNAKLVAFERHAGLGPTFAARLLGIPYVTYAQRRSGDRPMKREFIYHIEVLMTLDRKALDQRIKRVVYGNDE